MNFMNSEPFLKELYEYAVKEGLLQEQLLNADNIENYIRTSVDAYQDYPLFTNLFDGKYDKSTMQHMVSVDFRGRMGKIAGIAGAGYESVLLVEPPLAKKTGMLQYLKVAKVSDFGLLFHRTTYRQEDYEKFALEKRQPYLDAKTWYVYVFATKKDAQGQGYGKQLMKILLSFADKMGYHICLETDLKKNVSLYEHFGFRVMDASVYKGTLEHYVMVYAGESE